MWGHHNFEIEYFEKIIHKALEHPRSSGSTVAVIGHSKGSEMATVISQTLHGLVDLTFSSGGPYFAFFHEFSNGFYNLNTGSCSAAPSLDSKYPGEVIEVRWFVIQYWKLITLQMEHGKWTRKVLSKLLVECIGKLLYQVSAGHGLGHGLEHGHVRT